MARGEWITEEGEGAMFRDVWRLLEEHLEVSIFTNRL
jgi:hypothetical protein